MSVPRRMRIHCPSCAGRLIAVVGAKDLGPPANQWLCPYCRGPQVLNYVDGPVLYVVSCIEFGLEDTA